MINLTPLHNSTVPINKNNFGDDFKWGVSVAAYQIEGAFQEDGKGKSIWDIFTNKKGNVKLNQNGNHACDFYNRYMDDIHLMQDLHIPNFRFSIAWSRVLPEGIGRVNQKGIDFYKKKIEQCLTCGITPWITLYHWDLPHVLEQKGGWTNRDVIGWFSEYTALCVHSFGDLVNDWMVMNEPMVFTGAGYFLGIHAPGRKGLGNFLPAMHHATLCMGAGARIIKAMKPDSNVGTTFSCTHIDAYRQTEKDIKAAKKVDALLNRLFIEPILGLGYPLEELSALKKVEKYYKADDETLLPYEFDFIGIQNYTREIVKHSFFTPYLRANIINPKKRNVAVTLMNWEVYPESIYHILKKYGSYSQIKKIIITENGAAFTDVVLNGKVEDENRTQYIRSYLKQILRAQNEGVNVKGYFVWTLLDNFEWAEGFHPTFGIVHVNFDTQERIIKASGQWYSKFINGKEFL